MTPKSADSPVDGHSLLGLDVGDRRIGVAVSDPTGLLASPVEVYQRRDQEVDIRHLLELAQEYEAEAAVVGLPKNMNGSEGEQAAKTRAFAGALAASGLPVSLWDERLSTVEVTRRVMEQGRGKKRTAPQRVDSLAATLILQGYLDNLRLRRMG